MTVNGSTVRKKPVLPVSATGQLLESPLAETGPWAEKGPMRKTDTSQHLFRPILPNFEEKMKSETMSLAGGTCSQSVRQAIKLSKLRFSAKPAKSTRCT